ncbi:Golgi-associated RAB2B interactor protein 3-like [Procambarus clarkii]|uniref:Golgi-associated RAB2B interactor protein 3-like n=1 Tax=Procambarus clarkii TaxID=6728 RepID=UPI003742C270
MWGVCWSTTTATGTAAGACPAADTATSAAVAVATAAVAVATAAGTVATAAVTAATAAGTAADTAASAAVAVATAAGTAAATAAAGNDSLVAAGSGSFLRRSVDLIKYWGTISVFTRTFTRTQGTCACTQSTCLYTHTSSHKTCEEFIKKFQVFTIERGEVPELEEVAVNQAVLEGFEITRDEASVGSGLILSTPGSRKAS